MQSFIDDSFMIHKFSTAYSLVPYCRGGGLETSEEVSKWGEVGISVGGRKDALNSKVIIHRML